MEDFEYIPDNGTSRKKTFKTEMQVHAFTLSQNMSLVLCMLQKLKVSICVAT